MSRAWERLWTRERKANALAFLCSEEASRIAPGALAWSCLHGMEGCRDHPCEEENVSAELGQGSTAAESTLTRTDGTQLLVGLS